MTLIKLLLFAFASWRLARANLKLSEFFLRYLKRTQTMTCTFFSCAWQNELDDLLGFLCNRFQQRREAIIQELLGTVCHIEVRSIGYHISGEVISVLSLEGRYYNCHE